jgi:hypothetical protein
MTNQSEFANQKKDYQSPEVFQFGDVSQLTQAVNKAGNADGGKGNDKT